MSNPEVKELRKLININQDACEFYESACGKIENPSLESTFRNLESLHKGVVVNLQNYAARRGETLEAGDTFAGQARQFWGEMMANISNDVDETLVAQLEEAEDRCLHSIEDAMKNKDISAETKSTLQGELRALQKSHDYMKALKESMKAA